MDLSQIGVALLSAAFAAGGAYAGFRVELRHVWRSIDKLEAIVETLRRKTK